MYGKIVDQPVDSLDLQVCAARLAILLVKRKALDTAEIIVSELV